MSTNIFKIKTNELKDFLDYNSSDKLIVFYKQDCLFCKIQIDDIQNIAPKYQDKMNFAICDVTSKTKFCIENDIIGLPTIHIYSKNKLVYSNRSYIDSNKLENKIKELSWTVDPKMVTVKKESS